jgi:hypothetical protein
MSEEAATVGRTWGLLSAAMMFVQTPMHEAASCSRGLTRLFVCVPAGSIPRRAKQETPR